MKQKQKIVKDSIISDKDYDNAVIRASLRLSKDKQETFISMMKKGWAQSYGQKSKTQLRKMIKKVKTATLKGFYSGHTALPVKPARGWTGGKSGLSTDRYEKNKEEVLKVASKRKGKGKERLIKGIDKYLDASEYELRYGVNSKKSQLWRLKHGKSKNYQGRIKDKKTGQIKYYEE